jgi:drug/metabolite transporter (DMT)-like permease
MGPFAFGGARYALGTLSLVPFLVLHRRRAPGTRPAGAAGWGAGRKAAAAALAGAVLFVASSLLQFGLKRTTAAHGGFITSLYVVLVPLIGACFGRPAGIRIWMGAALGCAGLAALSLGAGLAVNPGDLLVLAGAGFWASHILLINRLVERMAALEIALGQCAACAVFSLAAALGCEPAPFAGLGAAAIQVLYGGLLSIGLAYTLQIVAQKAAHPAHAAIIMSMEALFASIGGVLFLHEPVTLRLAVGGALMLLGMIVSQAGTRHPSEDHDGVASSIIEAAVLE